MVFSIPNELLTSCQLNAQIRRDDTRGFYNRACSRAANYRLFQKGQGPCIWTFQWTSLTWMVEMLQLGSSLGWGGGLRHELKVKLFFFSHSKCQKSSWLIANQTVNSLLQLVNLFYLNGCWQKTLFCVTFIVISFPANWFCRLSAVYQAPLQGKNSTQRKKTAETHIKL